VADMREQIDDLIYAGFPADIDAERLRQYPRYLKAIKLRLNALELDPLKDDERMKQIRPWWKRYLDYLDQEGWYTEQLDEFRWLIEEFRVQIFAQKLGTQHKVSDVRLDECWKRVNNLT